MHHTLKQWQNQDLRLEKESGKKKQTRSNDVQQNGENTNQQYHNRGNAYNGQVCHFLRTERPLTITNLKGPGTVALTRDCQILTGGNIFMFPDSLIHFRCDKMSIS